MHFRESKKMTIKRLKPCLGVWLVWKCTNTICLVVRPLKPMRRFMMDGSLRMTRDTTTFVDSRTRTLRLVREGMDTSTSSKWSCRTARGKMASRCISKRVCHMSRDNLDCTLVLQRMDSHLGNHTVPRLRTVQPWQLVSEVPFFRASTKCPFPALRCEDRMHFSRTCLRLSPLLWLRTIMRCRCTSVNRFCYQMVEEGGFHRTTRGIGASRRPELMQRCTVSAERARGPLFGQIITLRQSTQWTPSVQVRDPRNERVDPRVDRCTWRASPMVNGVAEKENRYEPVRGVPPRCKQVRWTTGPSRGRLIDEALAIRPRKRNI